MSLFCNHHWVLISETTTKSKIEVLAELGVKSIENLIDPVDRKFIQLIQCEICGEMKRYVEDI